MWYLIFILKSIPLHNRVLRIIFGSKRDELTGGWKTTA
jgi:hypothetical protein